MIMMSIFISVFLIVAFVPATTEKSHTQPSNLMKAFETVFGNRTYYKKCENKNLCELLSSESWILKSAGKIAIQDFSKQFPENYWSCHTGSKIRNLFAKVYRESAYLAALVGVELMKAVIKGCTEGMLNRKSCNPKWPFCHEDIDFAKRFVYDFFKLKDNGKDRRIKRFILKHNIRFGVKTFEDNVDEKCESLKAPPFKIVCCDVPRPFNIVISELYKFYNFADKYTKKMRNSMNRYRGVKPRHMLKKRKLVYMHDGKGKKIKDKKILCSCKNE